MPERSSVGQLLHIAVHALHFSQIGESWLHAVVLPYSTENLPVQSQNSLGCARVGSLLLPSILVVPAKLPRIFCCLEGLSRVKCS